jgi:hypothetical protein
MKTDEHNNIGQIEQKENENGQIKKHLLVGEDDKASLLYYQELIKLYLAHDALEDFHAIHLKLSYRIFVKQIVLKYFRTNNWA